MCVHGTCGHILCVLVNALYIYIVSHHVEHLTIEFIIDHALAFSFIFIIILILILDNLIIIIISYIQYKYSILILFEYENDIEYFNIIKYYIPI